MQVQYRSTILTTQFRAPERFLAARAFLYSCGATSGQFGPKSSPGAAPRRPSFRPLDRPNTETEVHNEGNQFTGFLPVV